MRPKLGTIEIVPFAKESFDNFHTLVETYFTDYHVYLSYAIDESAAIELEKEFRRYGFPIDERHENAVRRMIFGERKLPTPKKLISNDPATVILWEDGSKTVSKCNDEEFSTSKGALVCAFRKVTHNRKRIDDYEDVITALSNLNPEQMRTIADTLNVAADAWEVTCDSR